MPARSAVWLNASTLRAIAGYRDTVVAGHPPFPHGDGEDEELAELLIGVAAWRDRVPFSCGERTEVRSGCGTHERRGRERIGRGVIAAVRIEVAADPSEREAIFAHAREPERPQGTRARRPQPSSLSPKQAAVCSAR